jgi:hypothetical protein
MSQITISDLPAGTAFNDNSLFEVSTYNSPGSYTSEKFSVSQLYSYLGFNGSIILQPARGGTGIGTYAVGDLIYASGTTQLARLADVATGNALISGGVGVAPSWGKIGLTTHVSGILPVANGGTGAATLTAAGIFTNGGNSFGGTAALQTTDNNSLVLGTNSTTALTIDTSQRVGVGLAADANYRFAISGGSSYRGLAVTSAFDHAIVGVSTQPGSSGVMGQAQTNGGVAIYGLGTGGNSSTIAVYGQASVGTGIYGDATTGVCIYAFLRSSGNYFQCVESGRSTTQFIIKPGGQTGIGTGSPNAAPNAAAILDITSTTQGVLLPRMTTTQQNNISSPTEGLFIANTTTQRPGYYNGSWQQLAYTSDIPTTTSGTYTPTLTNVANLDASTAYEAQYMRVGNTVTVSGKVDVDPTLTATSTQLGISLPVASNFGTQQDCGGVAFCPAIAAMGAAILADRTNDRAQLQFVSSDVNNNSLFFIFSYQVI